MPTLKKILKEKRTNSEYAEIRSMYDEKYFNLFLNSRDCKGLTREEAEYTLRKFWADGKIACFSPVEGMVAFAPYSPFDFNMYNFPIHVTLINEKGVATIPNKVMEVGKDVVLGWAMHSQQPIYAVVCNYLDRIADVEMAIRMNVKAHKIPMAIAVSEENEQDAEELNRNLESDDFKFFIKSGMENSLVAVTSGSPFILDKLHAYKVSLENELLTYLGINNIAMEKKERLITDEAEGNNALIKSYALMVDDPLEAFSKEIKRVFNVDVSWARREIEIEQGEDSNETPEK